MREMQVHAKNKFGHQQGRNELREGIGREIESAVEKRPSYDKQDINPCPGQTA